MTRKVTRHLSGPGNTIPKAATRLGWPEHVVRGGVERGEIAYTTISGRRRIPDQEIARLQGLFGATSAEPIDTDIVSKSEQPVLEDQVPVPALNDAELLARVRALLDQSGKSAV